MNLYDGNGVMIPISGGGDTKRPWLNFSHKGKALDIYGNSVYAFNRSHEAGMDGSEIDLRMTSDNVIVLSHDSDVTGTVGGVQTTLTIATSTYAQLAALTLFTIDNVDYHIVRLDDLARMAYYWGWILQLDFKSQSNTQACMLKASEVIRDNELCGKAFYFSVPESLVPSIVANDPLAIFDVGRSDITGTVWEDMPIDRVWRSVNRANLSEFTRDGHPFYVWDAGSAQAETIMNFKPDAIQWQADTDGASLSDTFLANVDWSFT